MQQDLVIDRRASDALRKLGVFPRSIDAQSGKPLTWVFNFTFSCDRELAKYHVSTFLSDEFGATNVQFFASRKDNRQCYATFVPRDGYQHVR